MTIGPAAPKLRGGAQMSLLVAYVIIVAIGQTISVSLGLLVDRYYPATVSVPVALAFYFATFWIAWRIAVRLTEPRTDDTQTPAPLGRDRN
jgi:hypothetical protein